MKIRAYTDGACSGNPGPGGWAAIVLLDEVQQEISGSENETTNNRMELKAVIETINLVRSLGFAENIKLDIYSDSAYVVNAVQNNWIKKWMHKGWKTVADTDIKNKDLWMQLHKQLEQTKDNGYIFKVSLIKVAGHSGDKYNEVVDKLAKREVAILKAW